MRRNKKIGVNETPERRLLMDQKKSLQPARERETAVFTCRKKGCGREVKVVIFKDCHDLIPQMRPPFCKLCKRDLGLR